MTHDSAPKSRETVEIPKRVAVNGFYGQQWSGSVSADRLTYKRMPDRSYALLDAAPFCTHIAMRMSNGDIGIILASHPEEQDNEQRGYQFTSVLMNGGIPADQPLRSIDLPYSLVSELTITNGQQLILGGIQSDGLVTDIVTYDKTKPVRQHDIGSLPESSITTDFLSALGRTA